MTRKIIIIEDDIDILDIMTFILVEEGYEVISSRNSEPLKHVHLHQPLVILMDNHLADGFGYDLCRKFKTDSATRDFPVVLVSASTDLDKIALESHADAFLKKPFDVFDLIQLVKSFE